MMSVQLPRVMANEAEVPVLRPLMPTADELLPYLRRIDASRIYTNHGPLVKEFEERVAGLLGLRAGGVASASSGTTALEAAILTTAGRPSAERPLALMPSFTYVATALAAEQCGYQPYLADIDDETWMLDPARLVGHPALAGVGIVIPVAPFGRPVPQLPWQKFQDRTGIPVVIDGAACFSEIVEQPERYIGSIPLMVSFHATKGFSTGEGGGVFSTDPELIIRVVRALNFGCYGSRVAQTSGTNGKMSEYHAAVGLAEFDGWARKRRAFRTVAEDYRREASRHGVANRIFVTPDIGMSYAVFQCSGPVETACVTQALSDGGIGWRLWYGPGLHHHPYLAHTPSDGLAATARIAPNLIGLPMSPDLERAQVAYIVATVAAAVQALG